MNTWLRCARLVIPVLLLLPAACSGDGGGGESYDISWGFNDVCTPNCPALSCGPDGCGGSCGDCWGKPEQCVNGVCDCTPSCGGKTCGSDGCGGNCGDCWGHPERCTNGSCVCKPDCTGKTCGPDDCGGSCGYCPGPNDICENSNCRCVPHCEGKICGSDGCGGDCGGCAGGTCNAQNYCTYPGEGGLTWVALPGGKFMMGCSPGDLACGNDEKPQHEVDVAPFEILETEVTEDQYRALTGINPSNPATGGNYPATWVRGGPGIGTSDNAQFLCSKTGGRLPTEAEWEYAARGGSDTAYGCGDQTALADQVGWYGGNSGGAKHPVKQKQPNGFGLYDMSGNVWEWTLDCYHPTYDGAPATGSPGWTGGCSVAGASVIRGGSFQVPAAGYIRVSYRAYLETIRRAVDSGVRCVRAPH